MSDTNPPTPTQAKTTAEMQQMVAEFERLKAIRYSDLAMSPSEKRRLHQTELELLAALPAYLASQPDLQRVVEVAHAETIAATGDVIAEYGDSNEVATLEQVWEVVEKTPVPSLSAVLAKVGGERQL